MKRTSTRSLIAVAFALTIVLADIGMGLDFDPVQDVVDQGSEEIDGVLDQGSEETDRVVDAAERVWEGGGSHLVFVDTMRGELAEYFEEMEPLPDDNGFHYYGGATPQADPGERFGRWGPDRWRHEWWRWGEESLQELAGGSEPVGLWHQSDSVPGGVLWFSMEGDVASYPQQALSAVVSPVVDLRDVEPLFQRTEEGFQHGVRPQHTAVRDIQEDVEDRVRQTGIVDVGDGTVRLELPAVQNASAALRLNHFYDFVADDGLRDGARVEVSRFSQGTGWQDWEPLVPSANALRVGDEEVSGRYSAPRSGTDPELRERCANMDDDPDWREICSQLGSRIGSSVRVHVHNEEDGDARGEATMGGVTLSANETGDVNVIQDPTGSPWLYQGSIRASSARDHRGSWDGFGGSSQGFVESVFDLSEHAGHLVRFRFLAASTTGGDGSQPNPGLGWMLDQLEVHAAAGPGVKVVAPVTPVEGALLGSDHGGHPPVVALQNTYSDERRVVVEIGIEGAGDTAQEVVLPPGPWGRVFVTALQTLGSLGATEPGLHHLRVDVAEFLEVGEQRLAEISPLQQEGSRFHFLRVGDDWLPNEFGPEWPEDHLRAVRVRTETLPLREGDEFHNPDERLIERGQEVLVHVDLVNLGPEEISLDLGEVDLLKVEFRDARGVIQGEMELVTDTVTLPGSRDASGLLGESDPVRRVTWHWGGSPDLAQVLGLSVEDGAGATILNGGKMRVEAMQSALLEVDFSNRWDFSDDCRRAVVAGRKALMCVGGGSIVSPASPVLVSDLRRGQEAFLTVVHRGGEGIVGLEVADNIRPQTGQRVPPPGLHWVEVNTISLEESSSAWKSKVSSVHEFVGGGWIRLNVTDGGGSGFVVDEVRLEVGPEGRRLPLLWENLEGDLVPQTSGAIHASGDRFAVLHGSAARASEHLSEDARDGIDDEYCKVWGFIVDFAPLPSPGCVRILSTGPLSGVLCIDGLCRDQVEDPQVINSPTTPGRNVAVDTAVPGTSILYLPEIFELDGARPILTFDHWMGPSVSAAGHVEVAHLDSDALRSLEEGRSVNITWEPVATFIAPRTDVGGELSPERVALWHHAGEPVLLRFRYQYDPYLQPGVSPLGWILDSIRLEQFNAGGPRLLHESSGNFRDDGYHSFRVDFLDSAATTQRAVPEILTPQIVKERCCNENGNQLSSSQRGPDWLPADLFSDVPRSASMYFSWGDPVFPICADRFNRNTYILGQSIITDPVDLRALDAPVLELEHGGEFTRETDHFSVPGRKVMDLEWQVLGTDGQWGQWQRATPHDLGTLTRLGGGLTVPGDRDQWVEDPFTEMAWNNYLVVDATGTPQRFDLTGEGPAGEIARFRFVVWEEWDESYGGSGTNNRCSSVIDMHSTRFRWHVYSMRIFEDTHIFDAAVTGIDISPDDRELVDQLAPGLRGGRDHLVNPDLTEAVVSGGGQGVIRVDVQVANKGRLGHQANITLDLINEAGARVEVPTHFIDRSQPGVPIEIENQNFGRLHLAGGGLTGDGQEATARFIMEIGGRGAVEPGQYTLRAAVDLDDAPDSNPANDLLERNLWVVPMRALDIGPDTMRVEPPVGVPEERRLLHVDLRNRGNVEEGKVTVKARVVQLVGFGTEADIGPNGHPYELEPRTRTGMSPGSVRSLTWDLEEDRIDDSMPPLGELLKPGNRYAVSITIHPGMDSVRDWWSGDRAPIQVAPAGELIDMIDAPGERCGCYHASFLAEDLIAGSDLTPEGTHAALDGYLGSGSGEDMAERWQASTRFRHDGEMLSAEGRDDLPKWRLIDAVDAEEQTGRSGVQGAAWHLPSYEGYEVLEHELVSPPLPGHVIDEASRGILDLRYASGLADGQARLEIRTLLPGGKWGEWGPVDEVRMQRVAVVLPPDFPRVISDDLCMSQVLSNCLGGLERYPTVNTPGHPIPPYYKITPKQDAQNREEMEGQPYPWEALALPLRRENFFSFGGSWSPFPLFREDPEHERNLESVRGLAMALERLVDELGPDNVGVFTTFPDTQDQEVCFDGGPLRSSPGWWQTDWWKECFGEFAVPIDRFDELGIAFDVGETPLLRVDTTNPDGPYELPLLGMDELGLRVGTYGALIVMGDGLTRWAASSAGRSTELDRITPGTPGMDFVEFDGVKTPVGGHGTSELEKHFQELLPALRIAHAEGVRVLGATGPAVASLGASRSAEGVPMSLWVTPNSPAGHRPPATPMCVVEMQGSTGYLLNMLDQPKDMMDCRVITQCGDGACSFGPRPGATYQYIAAPDAQAWVLRDLLVSGGAQFDRAEVIAFRVTLAGAVVPNFCENAPNRQIEGWRFVGAPHPLQYTCIIPAPFVSTTSGDTRYVTAPFAGNETMRNWGRPEYWVQANVPFTGNENVLTWIDEILDNLHGDSRLPAGTRDWERLPVSKGFPVAGSFTRDSTGRDRFVGQTVQFRITVESDPLNPATPGHGGFFLDSFQFFGNPSQQGRLDVRVADPPDGAVRSPNEGNFHVTVEVINRGVNPAPGGVIHAAMSQIPDRGDCDRKCEIPALHPEGPEGRQVRELQVGSLAGGERLVITVGGPKGAADPGAPDDIGFDSQSTPLTVGGRFPRIPDPATWNDNFTMIFNVDAWLESTQQEGHAVFDRVEVFGRRAIEDLIKEPARDIRIEPNQAIHGASSGTVIPGTEEIRVDVRLSNTGSFPVQAGSVRVEMFQALSHHCWGGPFIRCDAEGNLLGQNQPGDQKWRVFSDQRTVEVPRGVPAVREMVTIDLLENGLEPGVYQVDVTVRTIAPPGMGFADIQTRETRWVYLGDPDGETGVPLAVYDGLLDGITDEEVRQSFPQNADPDATSPFFVGSTDQCSFDPTTTDSTHPGQGSPLRHGWAIGGNEYAGPCFGLLVDDPRFFQWVRDPGAAAAAGTTTWSQASHSNNAPNALGLGDFGPDHLVWYPGHGISPPGDIDRGGVNGVAPTLANFAPGEAALVLDTRFSNTGRTGFVVELQVPQRICHPPPGGPGAPVGCRWNWNWGEDGEHWFPLTATMEGIPVDMDSPDFLTPDLNQERCRTRTGGSGVPQQVCDRFAPTNPLAGSQGLWGRDSVELPGSDQDGWVTLRYPIDPGFQDGLENYCLVNFWVDQRDTGSSQAFDSHFWRCMYTAAHIAGSNQVRHEIPRPVAFRLSAASFGGDSGDNFWHVRSLSLTAHELAIEGPDRFQVSMSDGESRLVPIEISNPSPVDDVVEINVALRRPQAGIEIGAARHSTAPEFQSTLIERFPAGSVSTVWVNVSADFGIFPQPGTYGPLEATVTARSLIAPLIEIDAALDITIRQLNRADLAIDEMVVNNRIDQQISASVGTPLVTSLHIQNEGREAIADPVLVRLWAQQIDPLTGTPPCLGGEDTCMELVGQEVVTTGFEANCFRPDCRRIVNFEWTPPVMGVFQLQAEVNLPRPGDEIRQIPEAAFSNNLETRTIIVGPVPLAELHVTDARLVRFDPETGCQAPENATTRLIDGHTYCVQAHVTNTGNSVAMFPRIEYSIGSREPWSFGQDWSPECTDPPTPDCLGSLTDEWITSTPVRAFRPTNGFMEFRIEVDTESAVQSIDGMERRLRIPVDNYDLELRSREIPELMMPKNGETAFTLDLRNTGTAVTTPVIHTQKADDLRFRLVQPPPLQPGETTQLTVVGQSGFSAAEGSREIKLVLSTAEDPLVHLPMSLTVTILEDAVSNATAIPVESKPGPTRVEVVADNTGLAVNSTWTLLENTGILRIEDQQEFQVPRHAVGVHNLTARVTAHTPPGVYDGTLLFAVQHGDQTSVAEAPYTLRVLPDPGLSAHLEQDQVVSVRGVDANVTIRLENTGNQVVQAILKSTVDSGRLIGHESVVVIEPGKTETTQLAVRPAESTRVLGETVYQWSVVGENDWRNATEPLLWTVHNMPGAVHLESTNLHEIEPRLGRVETVRATLLNPVGEAVHAEAIVVVNDEIHSRQRILLESGELAVVDLRFQLSRQEETLVQVVVRPSGSQVDPHHPVFHEVGAVQAREVTPATDAETGFAPAPGFVILLVMLTGAISGIRSLKHRQSCKEVKP